MPCTLALLAVMLLALTPLLFRRSQTQCILPNSTAHREVRHVLEKVILHQNYPRCSSLDTTYQRLVCEIWDDADEISLRRTTCSTGECSGSSCVSGQGSVLPCPDGSLNKTCLPRNNGKSYTCACRSAKGPDPCLSSYQWDSEWRNITSGRQGLFRQLCDQTTGQCVATEYLFDVVRLVEHIPLPMERISVSSEHPGGSHGVARVRTDYFRGSCRWAPTPDNVSPYIRFDFMEVYTVLGIVIRANCIGDRPTRVYFAYSQNFKNWSEVVRNGVYPEYGSTVLHPNRKVSFTYFFEEVISARYWNIFILEGAGNKSMKAEFMGRV